MAKKINLDPIDEQALMKSLQGDPLSIKENSEVSEVADVPETTKKTVSEKINTSKYEDLFLVDTHLVGRMQKTTYIRKEYHELIIKLISVLPKNGKFSIFSYIDNVLSEHFKRYRKEIEEIYNQHQKGIF